MISYADALEQLEATVPRFPVCTMPLAECDGLLLASDICSTVDSPPFDKVLMDGFAVRSQDFSGGVRELTVIGQLFAGQVPSQEVISGTTVQVMTGAPLPPGADAVVKVEDATPIGDRVRLPGANLSPEQNLIRRGASLRAGAVILQASDELTPSRIAILAEFGVVQVPVRRRPRVAILATGDELVPVDRTPGPGQIRNTNEAMLCSQLRRCGAIPVPLGIARDCREDLAAKIREGLNCDVLVLSGGVSAGQLDLVPSELVAAGVQEIFHKVNIKPGKPVWYGQKLMGGDDSPRLVFGLPGNPVSSMVCCELFVRTALRQLVGERQIRPHEILATVSTEFSHRSDRPTYHPAELQEIGAKLHVRILPWQGSSDLCSTASANGMAVLPAESKVFEPGDTVSVIRW